jgi:hypothetical protein
MEGGIPIPPCCLDPAASTIYRESLNADDRPSFVYSGIHFMTEANEPAAGPPTDVPVEQTPAAQQTGIQLPPSSLIQVGAPAPAGEVVIPLPPPRERPSLSAERLAAETRLLDGIIVAVVLLLAFFLASFAIQNSDFWMHLATGRLLAEGNYTFGSNPYSHPQTSYWANHAWLFDGLVYGLSVLGGGVESVAGQVILVVAKALIAVLLAWVLLSTRRPGQSLWIPMVLTALVLLTLSARLYLQPVLVSYLFLGLTIYLLTKPGRQPEEGMAGAGGIRGFLAARPAWLAPPLFVLWVNLDDWYFLGPLAVGLFFVGAALRRLFLGAETHAPGRLRDLALVFAAGLLACLVNPFHYHAFTLPAEPSYLLVSAQDWLANQVGIALSLPGQLTDAGRTFQILVEVDPAVFSTSSFFSLFTWDNFQFTLLENYATWALLPLVFAGLVSFGLNRRQWPWDRLLLCLVFGLLSAVQARFIPFFAVVAGPLAVLNFQDFLARRTGTPVRIGGLARLWSLGGRVATLLGGLALAALTWLGWLHERPDEPRTSHRVAWRVEAEPALRRAAEQLRTVQNPDQPGRAFNYTPLMAAYCAWFCPGEKTYFDTYRLQLFTDRARDFVRVRKALAGRDAGQPWQEIFRAADIRHVILADLSIDRIENALFRCWLDERQWVQPAVGNLSTLFGWLDPKRPTGRAARPFGGRTLDLNALAFGRKTSNRAPDAGPKDEADPAPAKGSAPAISLTPWEAQESRLYVDYFLVRLQTWPRVYAARTACWTLAIAPAGAGAGTLLMPTRLDLFVHARLFELVMTDRYIPAAAPVLAVRSVRRAVKANPSDPESYLALARAYLLLWNDQEGRWTQRPPPLLAFSSLDADPLQTLRAVQVVAALNRAVTLRPTLVEAHLRLTQIYQQMNYLDLALDHLQEAVRHTRDHPPRRGLTETAEAFRRRNEGYAKGLEALEKQLKDLIEDVSQRRKDYRLLAEHQNLPSKVALALLGPYKVGERTDPRGRGLAGEALKLLLKAKGSELDPLLAAVQLKLLLTTGRIHEVRQGLPELNKSLEQIERQVAPRFRLQFLNLKAQTEYSIAWLQALETAAHGDYKEADKALATIEQMVTARLSDLRDLASGLLTDVHYYHWALNQAHPYRLVIRLRASPLIVNTINGFMSGLVGRLSRQAEFHLLRGLVALEHGNTSQAATSFRKCRDISQDLVGRFNYPNRRIALRYLQALDEQTTAGKKP